MKQLLVSTLSLAALLGFGSAAHGAITFSYDTGTDELTVNVSEAVDFTTATGIAGDDIFVVLPGVYDTAATTSNSETGASDLTLTPNALGAGYLGIYEKKSNFEALDLIIGFSVFNTSIYTEFSLSTGTATVTGITNPDKNPTVAFLANENGDNLLVDGGTVAVPEPGAAAAILGLVGLSAVAGMRWRRRRMRG